MPNTSTHLVSIKIESVLDVPLLNLISLVYEIELFKN